MSGPRLRILYVAPYEPSDVAVRSRLLLGAIAERHEVHVITLRRGAPGVAQTIGATNAAFPSRMIDRARVVHRLTDPAYPLQAIAAASRPLEVAVRAALRSGRFDLVHVEHIRALPYLRTGPRRPPVLFDAVDCVSELFRLAALERPPRTRWLFRIEAERVARIEAVALATVENVIVASQRDARDLLRTNPCGRVAVVTNPVDLDRFKPAARDRAKTVVMTGKMSFHANAVAARWLCEHIWPLVREQHPDARLVIAGASPDAWLRARNGRDVTVTGYVDDIAAVLQSAAVSVAPLRYAVGVQNKVLEALACATPVVATPVAVGDLTVRPGRDLLIGRNPAELAARINFLLSNDALARQMGESGRAHVERHHSIENIADRLEAEYRETLRMRGAHSVGWTDAAAGT